MLGMECSWIKPQPTEEQDYIIIDCEPHENATFQFIL